MKKISLRIPKQYRLIITTFQVILDAVVVFFSFYLAFHFWKWTTGLAQQSWNIYHVPAIIAVFMFLIIFWRTGLYKIDKGPLNVAEFRGILAGCVLGFLILLSLFFFMQEVRHTQNPAIISFFVNLHHYLFGSQELEYSRLVVTYSFVFMLVLMFIERSFFYKLHQKLHSLGFGNRRVLIYGCNEIGKKLAHAITASPKLGYNLIGFVDNDFPLPKGRFENKRVYNGIETLRRLIKFVKIDLVLIATSPQTADEEVYDVIKICERYDCKYQFVPRIYGLFLNKVTVNFLSDVPLISVKEIKLSFVTKILKRTFDIVGSALLMVVLAPVFLITAIVVKLTSRGPIIFTQKRVGEKGKAFNIYKFRSMYVDAPRYEETPRDLNDKRITPVGRFIRKFCIDELPQLVNVLKGDMSLVGPRPEMPFIVEKYTGYHLERLAIKPGITGLWQISHNRKKDAIHNNIDYDLYYIENVSLLLDVIIILKTVGLVLRGGGS